MNKYKKRKKKKKKKNKYKYKMLRSLVELLPLRLATTTHSQVVGALFHHLQGQSRRLSYLSTAPTQIACIHDGMML